MNLLTKAVNNYRADNPEMNLRIDQFYVRAFKNKWVWLYWDEYTVEEFISIYER